jgi:hypothetical protein
LQSVFVSCKQSRPQEALEGFECPLADVMFNSFGVISCRIGIDAETAEDRFHDLVTSSGCGGQALAFFGKKDAAIGALCDEVFLG